MERLRREVRRRPKSALALQLALGLGLSSGLLLLFLELSEEVVQGESRRVDTAVLRGVAAVSPGWFDVPMRLITALGYYWFVIPALVFSAYLFYRSGYRLSAALLVASTGGSIALTTVLKIVFRRARPEIIDSGYEASFYSFPSGHATVAVGFYGALALLIALRLESPWRWLVAAAGAILIALIGFSRLYLGVHYPTDVLAGYLAASLWLVSVWLAWRLWRLAFPPGSRPRKPPV
ncbi:phosphatase PAP2 family protein [Rubrobacter aplysinae]|uniref:phosphatase PAP2 family protein n=1 Tax=Rubrobacter aplysinae TaxID=909625 RepID=UPI00064C1CF4|nr:phosphatase PAP2 family protein [Rubrobacter aplysinae]